MKSIDDLRAYFNSGKTLSISGRITSLKCLRQSILSHKNDLFDAFVKDYNKHIEDVTTTELGMVIQEIDYMIKHLKKLAKPERRKTGLFNFPSKGYIYKEPHGVCFIMAPWNYPFQLTMIPVIDAIATGNTMLVKPSSNVANVANVIKEMLSIFPDEYIHVTTSRGEEGHEFLEEKFDFIFFTGGVDVGSKVLEAAAKFLTPVVLELGGKSPAIICDDADLELAAKRLAWGKFLNAGQTCVAPDYVYVPKIFEDEFILKVKAYTEKYYYEDGKLRSNFPYIVNERHAIRVEGLINKDKLVFGGKRVERSVEPTILRDVEWSDSVMQEEIFGPIMPILTYDNFDELISLLKTKEKPLALYLFTKSKKNIKKVMDNLSFGGGCINDCIMHLTSDDMPFGGVGLSGMGSYHGAKSFEVFSHEKSVLKKGKMELNLKYPPIKKNAFKLIERVCKVGKNK